MQQQARKSSHQLPSKTVLEQTLHEIQNRVSFFASHNISAQNSLAPTSNLTVRSISQILTPLKYFHMSETPLNMNLASMYTNEQNRYLQKWAISPPSEGQDSINQQQIFQPSFKWLISAFVDPNHLQIDQPEPKRIEKGKVPEDWSGVHELIFVNVNKDIYKKTSVTEVETSIKKKFAERYSWLKFKRAKECYYKGKPSIILKFGDSNSASFVYFNYANFKSNRQEFGENCQIFRVTKDQTKQYSKHKNWIILLFRHLPLSTTKQQLISIFNQSQQNQHQEVNIKWIQELVEICGAKYTICRLSYLDDALLACSLFNAKKIKDAKVNIHPRSSKNWRAQQIMQEQVPTNIIEENQKLEQIQKSY